MRWFIAWAVNNRAAMNLIQIAVLLVGILSTMMLRREVFPNFELDILLVSVPYPGASPEEVEEGICLKVEEAVRSLDGIKRMTSIARESVGFTVLEVNPGIDVQKLLNEIRSEVDRIPSFPELAEDPEFQQITFRAPAIRIGILADETSIPDADLRLRDIAEEVRSEVLQLKSVSQVNIVGERPYQIDVEISEEMLRKYGLTLQTVASKLRRENVEIPGGKIQTSSEAVLLRGKNKRLLGKEIAELPLITRPDGAVLTVADLGTVYDGFEDTQSFNRVDGKPAIVISVDRTNTEDLIAIVDEVKKYAAAKELPSGFSLALWNDTSIDVRERIELLTEDGLQGLILVFLVLATFLEFRLAFWVAMGIPFAVLATCGVLYGTGDTLNMLTLFSFLMALGILVDDAIVVSENFHTHRAMGKSLNQAAIDASSEVCASVSAGVMCTVIAFVPLFFVTGVMGKFIACMPVTIIAMLLISLVEGFSILPCHLGHEGMINEAMAAFRRARQSVAGWNAIHYVLFGIPLVLISLIGEVLLWCVLSLVLLCKRVFDPINRVADVFVNFCVNRLYLPLLKRALANVPLVLALQVVYMMVTATFFAAGFTKYITFPTMDSRILEAKLSYPDGTPATVTDQGIRQMAAAIRRVHERFKDQNQPLVELIHESIGQTSGTGDQGPDNRNTGEFIGSVYVQLVETQHRNIKAQDIVKMWRDECGPIVGAENAYFDVQKIGPGGKAIEFKLLGNIEQWPKMEEAAERIKTMLSDFKGVVDVGDDSYQGKMEYQIKVNDRARSMGVSTAELAETVRASFYGEEVMRLQRGRHEVKLMVRYPAEERNNLSALDNVRVRGSDGAERPINELADFDIRRGYSEIQRVDQKRAITISADVEEGSNPGEVLGALQAPMMEMLASDYPGLSIRWEGQKEQDNESIQSLLLGSAVAIFAMYVLLTFQLESMFQPLIIIYVIPFAVAGALWGHMLMGLEVTLFSIFGMVALMGMVVNDSIVLLDFINARFQEKPDEPIVAAILEAGKRRIRPVALNTVTGIIGIIPLIADRSLQAQVLIPMGVSLVFGLTASTALGLFIVPTMYLMLSKVLPPEKHGAHDHDGEFIPSPDNEGSLAYPNGTSRDMHTESDRPIARNGKHDPDLESTKDFVSSS